MNKVKVKTIVLSGGGLKGIGYLGVLKALEEKNMTQDLETYIGTSIGAFFGLLLVLGYDYTSLYKIFKDFDAQTLIEYKMSNLLEKFGLDDGIKLEEFIKIFLKNKGYNEDITMKELHTKTKKTLVFASCKVNTKKATFIDHETFPDLPVYKGARMSMNIPFVFSPVEYKGEYFIDGCFTCNLPVFYISKPCDEERILIVFLKDDIHTFKKIETIYDYFSTIPKCSFSTMEYESLKYADVVLNSPVLKLDVSVKDLKFSMTIEQKIEIIDKSYKKCKEFLS